MLKYSKQREEILNYLQNTTAHPTAEQIYQDLKHTMPSLSLATVYRNLNLLQELNMVSKLDTGAPVDRFDANIKSHAHFICDVCHEVFDIFTDLVDLKKFKHDMGKDFTVKSHRLYLYGTCEKCNIGNQG